MEGNITVLVKQQILNEENNKTLLTVHVSSLQSDLLDWQCAVFTENTLRAVASFSSISSTTDAAANLKVQRGSDVTLRCDVPRLSESSTLQWIKDTGQTSNTTLVYSNSAHIILHNVDDHSEGIYYCKMIENGSVDTVINHTITVTIYAEGKKHNLYRQSSSNSDLLLIFKSKKNYQRLIWTWESTRQSKTELIAVEKGGEVQVKGANKMGEKTSTTYNGQCFILHISPVEFNYDGTYRSFPESNNSPYTTTILHTIRVSAEPSGDVLRNQSVILTCEVSDVSDPVTLVWLRMEGNITVLVKQQILNEQNNKTLLTVHVSSLQSDLLDWQCAVFTENTLRAVASFSSVSSTTDAAVSEESEPVYMNISKTMNARAQRNNTVGNRNQRPEVRRQLTAAVYLPAGQRSDAKSESISSWLPSLQCPAAEAVLMINCQSDDAAYRHLKRRK
ncbi:hypothetical protein E1301_Tti008577 [Triplophysa tibetana]|uniref:Ig-like domain-containing protein n=1 Tax=Triplophysa tibetana TaxID=1572043 RepID=A0A5A9P1E3_9TELE|nr:hypothetical protein E1301_Tti008577 [Triplophysa tibetana]